MVVMKNKQVKISNIGLSFTEGLLNQVTSLSGEGEAWIHSSVVIMMAHWLRNIPGQSHRRRRIVLLLAIAMTVTIFLVTHLGLKI